MRQNAGWLSWLVVMGMSALISELLSAAHSFAGLPDTIEWTVRILFALLCGAVRDDVRDWMAR